MASQGWRDAVRVELRPGIRGRGVVRLRAPRLVHLRTEDRVARPRGTFEGIELSTVRLRRGQNVGPRELERVNWDAVKT